MMDDRVPRQNDANLLGTGLYTVPEASRLINVPSARIRRWLGGYHHRNGGVPTWSPPLWEPQIPRLGKEIELGFRDLLELRCVDALVETGISLHAIRLISARARELIRDGHPLSNSRFKTDGRTVFLQVGRETGEPVLLDLLKGQYAFNRIIDPSLRDLQFGADGGAVRWWPLSREKGVMLDPQHSFGQPVVADGLVPTRTLADAVTAEGSAEKVASLYEVSVQAVRNALRFEQRLAA